MNIHVPIELLKGNRLEDQFDKIPKHLQIALKEIGTKEFSNGSNPKIDNYFRNSNIQAFQNIKNDDIPWCAIFANYCLEQAGITGTKSAMAKSFLKWGIALETPQLGSIVVFDRGSNPELGHVGFFMGFDRDGSVRVLGGNQSNAVTISSFNPRTVKGYRWSMQESDLMFNAALQQVLKWEAPGFIDDPRDLGGATYRGITLETYIDYTKLIDNINLDINVAKQHLQFGLKDHVLRDIYYRMYWLNAECHKLIPVLSFFHFDTAVLQGPITAIKLLQQALNVEADGEIGPITLNALHSQGFGDLLDRYRDIREERFRNTSTADVHLNGWLNRLSDIYNETLKYLKGEKLMPLEQQPTIPPGIPHTVPQPAPVDPVGALASALGGVVVSALAPTLASLAQSYAQQTALLQTVVSTLSRIEAKLSQPAVPTFDPRQNVNTGVQIPNIPIPGLPLGGALIIPLVNALLGRITEEISRR